MLNKRRFSRLLLWSIPVGAVLIQLIPYGRSHENPPVVSEPHWNSPRTKELFLRSCGDCHSNQTRWPWYSEVAPLSWALQRDVEEGRRNLNVSEYGVRPEKGARAARELADGEMPPALYAWLHPGLQLGSGEKTELLRGLVATFGEEHGPSAKPR